LVGWIFQKTKGTSRAGNFHNSVSKYTNLNLEGRHTPSSSNTVGNRRYTHTHTHTARVPLSAQCCFWPGQRHEVRREKCTHTDTGHVHVCERAKVQLRPELCLLVLTSKDEQNCRLQLDYRKTSRLIDLKVLYN